MKIKNLAITSPSDLDLELDITSPVCLLSGEHSELALDLIRELISDYGAKNNPDCYDDGHFVIHSNIEMDGNYLHIVGNGKVDTTKEGTTVTRSNAYTLHKNGNGWYAGTVEASGIILRSANKKFLLTIDDSGTLKATEVK